MMDTTEHPVTPATTLNEQAVEVSALTTISETVIVIQNDISTPEAITIDTTERPSASTTSSEEVMASSVPIGTSETVVVAHDGTTAPEAIVPKRKKFRLSIMWYLVRFKKDSVLHVCRDAEIVYRRRERDRKIVSFGKYGGSWYECVLLAENSKKTYLQQELHAAMKRSKINIGRRGRKTDNFSLVRFYLTRDYQILSSSELGDRNESGYCAIKCPDGAVRRAIVIQRGTFEDLTGKLAKCRNFDELTTPEKTKTRHPSVPYTPRVRVPLPPSTQTISPSPLHPSALCSPDVIKSPPHLLSPMIKKSPLLQRSSYKSPRSFKRSDSMQSSSSCNKMIALPPKKRLFDDAPGAHPIKIEEPGTESKDLGTLTLPSTPENLKGSPHLDVDPLFIDSGIDKPFLPNSPQCPHSEVDPLSIQSPVSPNSPQSPHSEVDPLSIQSPVSPNSPQSPHSEVDALSIESPVSPNSPQSPHSAVDPYATDSDTEYIPSISSLSSSPAPSLSSELEMSISSILGGDDIDTAGPSSAKTKPPYKRKASACPYCQKLCVRLQRHLKAVHESHPQVVQVLKIADKRERTLAWRKLRLAGNYKYNCIVLQKGEGKMILQRDNPQYKAEDYLPCISCKGFFKRKAMYKHVKRCRSDHVKYERMQSLGMLSLPKGVLKKSINVSVQRLLTTLVYPRMLPDKITYTAQADEMIVVYGLHYCQKNMQEKSKAYLHRVASHKMRSLARILLVLKKKYGKTCTLRSFLVPQSYDDIVDATATVSGLKEGTYASPSFSIQLGHTLKTCASILIGEAARTGDDTLHESSSRFLTLMNNEWRSQLTAMATQQLRRTRFQNPSTKLLPLAADVVTFSRFLQSEESRLVEKLKAKFTFQQWAELNEVLLCSLILFNRKRVGDIEKIHMTSFQNHCEASPDSAIYETLDASQKITAALYRHFYTTGKKYSQVPVMVPMKQIPAFDLMISLRKKAGVADDNSYLFGKDVHSFFNGCQAMRTLSLKSGAKKPHLLRSTKLRKQVATMSQVMNMKSGDLDVLAKYLGHSIDVHRQFYRLPDEALHLAKISKLLVAVSSGDVEGLRGKSLDELETPNENTEVDYLGHVDEASKHGSNAVDDARDSPDDSRDSTDYSRDSPPVCEVSTSTVQKCKPRSSTAAASPKRLKRICPPSSERRAPQMSKPWSTAEKDAVRRHFSVSIEEQICPNKAEVDACLRQEPILRSRSWKVIKACVRNMAVTRARQKQNASKICK